MPHDLILIVDDNPINLKLTSSFRAWTASS
jgi:hypothetical protein